MCRLRANFGRLAHSLQNARRTSSKCPDKYQSAGREHTVAHAELFGSFPRKELGGALRIGQTSRRLVFSNI